MKNKNLMGDTLADVLLPNNQAYYDRLHNRIMARVEETEIETQRPANTKIFDKSARYLRDHWRGWLYTRDSRES